MAPKLNAKTVPCLYRHAVLQRFWEFLSWAVCELDVLQECTCNRYPPVVKYCANKNPVLYISFRKKRGFHIVYGKKVVVNKLSVESQKMRWQSLNLCFWSKL